MTESQIPPPKADAGADARPHEPLAERNYLWILEHQILPNLHGLKYVALLKAIEVLKGDARRVAPPEPLEALRARIYGLVNRGSEICVAHFNFNGTPSCERCGYTDDVHLLRDILKAWEAQRLPARPAADIQRGAVPASTEPLDETEAWFRNLNEGVRQLVSEQASRKTRRHLLAAIDEAIDRLRAQVAVPLPAARPEAREPLTDYDRFKAAHPALLAEAEAELAADEARWEKRDMADDTRIVDPSSEQGQRMIRNAAYAHPTTQGDPAPAPTKIVNVADIEGPTVQLCYSQSTLLTRCDRKKGHGGPHTWQLHQAFVAVMNALDVHMPPAGANLLAELRQIAATVGYPWHSSADPHEEPPA
jgi:hypothetical protein